LGDFDRALIDVIGNERPESLEKAIELVRLKFFDKSDKGIMDRVLRLESEGKILFEERRAEV